MYKLRSFDDERWVVVDPGDQEVYTGTLRECEHWLDRQENITERSIPREPGSVSWLGRLWELVTGAGRRRPQPGPTRLPDAPATPSSRHGQ